MKKRFIVLWMMVAVCLQIASAADGFEFRATAPNLVQVGQHFRLEYNIKNASVKDFQAPDFTNFDILMGPSESRGTQVSIINGNMTRTENIAYTYVLSAKTEGTFTISPARFTHEGKTVMSNAITIKVVAASAQQSNASGAQSSNSSRNEQPTASANQLTDKDVFCVAEYSKKKVYEQEQILVTIKLYHKGNVTGIDDIKFPEYKGFVCQEINIKDEERNVGIETYNGERYYAYIIREAILYPQRSGSLEIESGKISIKARVQTRTSGRRSIFDMDDFFNTTYNVKKDLNIKGTTIEVMPLPSAGKPENFNGAVGSFKLETSINSTEVTANDAVNLKVKISGNGNLKYAKDPEISFPNDFELYDPKVNVNGSTTRNGFSGSKTIEYLAIPRYAGTYEIPSQTFSYFDPKTKKYETLHTTAYTLQVAKDENASNENVVSNFGNSNKENVKYIGQDIHFINTKETSVSTASKPFFGTTNYWLWYIIPLCIFSTLFILYRKQLKENANISLVKNKRANKLARKRLKQAEIHLKANEKEAFYEETQKALWGYVSDKLNIPMAELNQDNIESKLANCAVELSVIKEFMDILQTCEFARFAPTDGHNAMDSLYEKSAELISTLDEQIKK